MNRIASPFYIALLASALLACAGEFTGEIVADGKPFVIKSCRSGDAFHKIGVEVTSKAGGRIQFFQRVSGGMNVNYFPAGQSAGVEFYECGPFHIENDGASFNDVDTVKGSATLDCEKNGHSLKGSFTFANCH